MADELDLDLVKFGEEGGVSICRLLDYSKYVYKVNKAKKNVARHKVDTKEIKIRPWIAEHDMRVKADSIDRILKSGDRVKITIQYRGKLEKFVNQGEFKINKLLEMVTHKYKIDKGIQIEGNKAYMVLSSSL